MSAIVQHLALFRILNLNLLGNAHVTVVDSGTDVTLGDGDAAPRSARQSHGRAGCKNEEMTELDWCSSRCFL